MGMRFRKSFKLCPGVRTTVSLSGVSVSAGVKGARVTASKRGLMATLGIPGTGIYYQENLTKSGRRKRTNTTSSHVAEQRIEAEQQRQAEAERRRQAEAEKRRLEQEQRRLAREQRLQESLARIQQYESEQREIVNCWRAQIDLVPPSAYEAASELRPFVHQEKTPKEPNPKKARNQLAGEVRVEFLKIQPVPKLLQLCVVAGAFVPALFAHLLITGFFGFVAATVLYCGGAFLGWTALTWWWSQEFEDKVQAETERRWPDRESQLKREHQEKLQEFENRRVEAEKQWTEAEMDRTAWARKLVLGDVDALNDAVSASLADLDFPFETSCDTSVANSELTLVNVDLPEIEDVISEKAMHVMKDGNISEKNRKQSDRYEEYAQLVAGLTILLGTTAFSAAPTVNSVIIGAYTQRLKRGVLADDYVIVARFTRSQLSSSDDLRTCDPIRLIRDARGTMEQTQHGKLKSVQEPDWSSFA